MKKTLIALSVIGLLTACSGMSTLKTENTKEKQVPDWYLDHVDVGQETKAWYTPWDKEGFYYAVAEDVSPSMEMSLKKATLKAKAKLADRVNGEMNNRTTLNYNEGGNVDRPIASAQAQDLIVNLIAENILRTYGVTKKMVVFNPELNNYRSFVMIKVSQADVKALADRYDAKTQAKLNNRVAGKSVDETAAELIEQAKKR
jgi:hypothetical protein